MTSPHDQVEFDTDQELDAALAAGEDLMSESLAQLLAVPADLRGRTRDEVTDGLAARSSLSVMADLVGLGWRTARVLAATDHDSEVAS